MLTINLQRVRSLKCVCLVAYLIHLRSIKSDTLMTSELSYPKSNAWLTYRGITSPSISSQILGLVSGLLLIHGSKKILFLLESEGFSFLIIVWYIHCIILYTISVITCNVKHVSHSSSYISKLFLSQPPSSSGGLPSLSPFSNILFKSFFGDSFPW